MNDNENNLKKGSSLQGGKYVIERTLGRGGFGITYLGVQVGLNRKVAIKEFFMKDYCERDSSTSHVTAGSQGSKKIVERFLTKFVKEAQTIAQLDNSHLIKIHDIFRENGTAYYVMEYIDGGSLEDYVNKRQRLDEASAIEFVGQIADALTYIHGKNILHLDVKPSNVLLRDGEKVVLIDFGISKRYDEQDGQTSTTPVGISKGYAPFEQYTQDGVSHFEPSTDVYSLGAVLYKLLTGDKPSEASVLISDGLTIPPEVSPRCTTVIRKAMASKKVDRYQSAAEMKAALNAGDVTILGTKNKPQEDVHVVKVEEEGDGKKFRKYVIGAIALVALLVAVFFMKPSTDPDPIELVVKTDSMLMTNPAKQDTPSKLSSSSSSTTDEEQEAVVNPKLTLSCKTSGASLYVDGKKKGTGKWSGELSAGKHKVEARLDGYETETETLELVNGGTYSHTFPALIAISNTSVISNATLTLSCRTSGASLFVDGKKKGTEKWSGELSAGKHTIEAKLDGYETETETLDLANGKEYSHTFPALTALPKETQSTVTTNETSASVAKPTTGTINGHEYVDLGLSVKWATCNVGASIPSGYGNYYAWGEISTKSEYTKENSSTYGKKEINDIAGDSSYDAARANWGGSWRLPSGAECNELIKNCKTEWTTQNGVKGRKFTSKKNGKSIFLPAAGKINGSSVHGVDSYGLFWSSKPLSSHNAVGFFISRIQRITVSVHRYTGLTIRPVSE